MTEVWPKKILHYDEDGLPMDPSGKERPLYRDLRAGNVIPPVELLARDPKAFEAFLEGLINIPDEELRNRLSIFAGKEYWTKFIELVHTKRWYVDKNNKAQLADDAANVLKDIALKNINLDLNMHSQMSIFKPIILLTSQYILGKYAIYQNKKMIEQTEKINTVLEKISKILFNDEEALLKDVLAELDTMI